MTALAGACGGDPPLPVVASSAPSALPTASASESASPVPPPDAALFLSFDAEPTERPDDVVRLEEIASKVGPSAHGRVELTGSSTSTGDLTIDRSKALRRGEALRNWFIEHHVSGAKVVVKNPGPPCVPPAGEDAVKRCRGVHVDVWF